MPFQIIKISFFPFANFDSPISLKKGFVTSHLHNQLELHLFWQGSSFTCLLFRSNDIISLLTYLNNVNWYKQTVVHSSLQKWILVINIFPILNIYPWFRNILSWRVVGCCEERVFTFNLQSVTFSIVKQCEM